MAAEPPRHAPRTGGRPRILLAMIAAGGGHRAAARALEAALQVAFPDRFDVRVLDFMAEVGDVELDRRHKNSWRWLLDHPRWAYAGQRAIDVVPEGVMRGVQDALLAAFSRHAAAYVNDHAIDLAVALHFMPLRALCAAAARRDIGTPVLGVSTELFDGNALWAEHRVDELMVASEASRARFAARGVPPAKLNVTGYPLDPKYLEVDRDQDAMRRRLGLDPGPMVVLHVAGGEGIGGSVEPTVRRLLASGDDVHQVVICGSNEALRRRLDATAASSDPGRLRVEGFASNLHEWMVASDVVVGKAGPGITTEALVLGRPILHTSFAAANEKLNVDYCVARGAGGYYPRPSALAAAVDALASDRDRLAALQGRAAAAAPAVGTERIVERIVHYLGARLDAAAAGGEGVPA